MIAATALRLLYDVLTKHDERSIFLFFERVMAHACPRYKFHEFERSYMYDEKFLRYYESFIGRSYLSLDRKYALDQLMKLVCDLEGDTVECGVFQGASSYLMCRRIIGLHKRHYAFDSFEGLSVPVREEDGEYWKQGDLASKEEILRQNLKEFDFVEVYKGWIPERFHEVADHQFCFLHIDVDLFQPTLDSLRFFYPRMVPGGMIVCDDYGFRTCPGAEKAMDDFFADKPEKVVSLPTGQGLIIKR